MSAPTRVMYVHAHPDDEALWTGGAIARHVDRGDDVLVVTCTWANGTDRHGELCDALGELGVRHDPVMLGYADARVPRSAPGRERFCDAPFDALVDDVARHVRHFRPEIAVTYDAAGIYGHPDHVHAYRVVCAAIDAAAHDTAHRSGWQVSSLYLVTVSESMVAALAGDILAGVPREELPGAPDTTIDTTLDVSSWVSRKLAAITAHRTEVSRSRTLSALMALPDERLDPLLGIECYERRDLTSAGRDL